MKHAMTIMILVLITPAVSWTTQTVRGNGSLPDTFATPVQASVFDTTTGTLYVGLASGSTNFALARIGRIIDPVQLSFSGIAPEGSLLNDADIQFLALATRPENGKPLLAGAVRDTLKVFLSSNNGAPFSTLSDTISVQSEDLLDASGAPIAGNIALTANNDFIFSAVSPDGSTFGEENSGIAVVHIDRIYASCQECIENIEQTAANVGDGDIKAKRLDVNTQEIFINNAPTIISDAASLFWDEKLQRLFIGLQLSTQANSGDGVRAVVTATITSAGELIFAPIAPDGAFDATKTQIVGVISDGNELAVSAIHVNTLHASTGPSYLIVNGGDGTADTVNNTIYALPLIDNPASPTEQGTLADKNSALIHHRFQVPATSPADMTTSTDPAARVGAGFLPILANTPISNMITLGDTVYVSIASPQDADNDTGIFSSHAMFDDTGKIVRWTPWARAFPFEGVAGKLTTGRVSFFAVDAVTGNIWATDGEDNETIVVTEWDFGQTATSLASALNAVLTKGSYSALDLDAHTRGFNGNCIERYALFGGVDIVIFARTGENFLRDSQGPNVITTDFSLSTNFLLTRLPQGSGCVTCLAYTSFDGDNLANNSFFAGTRSGLFEFGLVDPAVFDVLTDPPFDDVVWTLRTDIQGSIVDMVASGNGTYVATFQTSQATPFKSRLYLIPPAAPAQIIAETGVDEFKNVLKFNGVRYISTNDSGTTEQVILATNIGLFATTRAGGVQQTDTTRANAGWGLIPDTKVMYPGIVSPQAPAPINTVWPLRIADQSKQKTFTKGSIQQISGTDNAGPFSFVPENFNDAQELPFLPSLINFWSDGNRRLFTVRQPEISGNKTFLMSFPFDSGVWATDNPQQTVLFDPGLTTVRSFNWSILLQTSGVLMAGTNSGVIALE